MARITDAKEIKSVELKTKGFTSIPKLTRMSTVMDQNYAELIVTNAINEVFRVFNKVLEDYNVIERNISKMHSSS